jgi:hypothetical protein
MGETLSEAIHRPREYIFLISSPKRIKPLDCLRNRASDETIHHFCREECPQAGHGNSLRSAHVPHLQDTE